MKTRKLLAGWSSNRQTWYFSGDLGANQFGPPENLRNSSAAASLIRIRELEPKSCSSRSWFARM